MSTIDVFLPCIGALLDEAAKDLSGSSESPRLDAEVLLAFALQVPRSYLFGHRDEQPGAEKFAIYRDLVMRRRQGEPIAYIVGHREFWSLDLLVNRHTLIPRPETEVLVQQALELTAGRTGCSVLDLGTGCGAIALAIASERPGFRIVATDASAEAVALARYNSARLGYPDVDFACGEWFDPVAGRRFDLIVSNPPYVADNDPHLAQAGIGYEPRAALAAGTDGLDCLRHIVRGAGAHLAEGGWLAFEHGAEQGDAARCLLAAAGFTAISTQCDLENRERVTVGCFGEDLA